MKYANSFNFTQIQDHNFHKHENNNTIVNANWNKKKSSFIKTNCNYLKKTNIL